ncbi:MAG: hypothetical protein Q8J78_07350 [Moraxellaceae bacterium]|nr:hypothetical protein [Moraxellaceae bacterium]
MKLSPVSADYLVVLARVEEMRYPLALIGDDDARPGRERAVQLYRDAIKRRPTWPYTYADLAYALMRLDRVDAELEAALVDGARLGPWEPEVMQAIIDVGFEAWYRLSPEARRVVADTLIRSQSPERAGGRNKKHADEMWERVRVHRKQALACGLLPMTNERNRHICHPDNW